MIDWHFFSFKNEFLILNWIETVSGVGVIAYTMCVSVSVCLYTAYAHSGRTRV